ncbi:hypothetical protein [Nodularia sphaerocarpa]|uniref:hypothetical protein n=1 Tax=Nodularia sphaerocarpa TaxID=137816 RepID=UPI001EFBAEBF|nr:hypothetical protein [Nodularia sphaerocarpa]MDB9373106.1 hypothetical protein [Nodularia sphaerocarpa CS-585]
MDEFEVKIMSVKDLQSDLLMDLSTEEQQHLSGGYGFGFGGFRPGFGGRGWGGHRGFGGFGPGFGGRGWGGHRRGGWFY